MIRFWLGIACLLALLAIGSSPAVAGCTITGLQSISPATLNAGTYSASSAPAPTTFTVTIIANIFGNGIGSCQGAYGLVRATSPLQMTRTPPGPIALPYTITRGGGPILSFGPVATIVQGLPNTNAPNGSATAAFTVNLEVTPGTPLATPPTGSYFDQLSLQLFDVRGGTRTLAGQLPLTVAATVVNSCFLSAPGAITLDFSSDVASGIPAGAVKSTSFNVSCTAPSRVQLSGSALVKTPAAVGNALFDAQINYRAVASFAGASTTLITSGTAPVTTTSTGLSSIIGAAVPVTLDVNLIAGKPLIGGSPYASVLTIRVDPAF